MKAFFAYTLLCTINMMLCSTDGAPNLFRSCNAKSSALSMSPSIQSSGKNLYGSSNIFNKKKRQQSLHMNCNSEIIANSDLNSLLKVKIKIQTIVVQYRSGISNAIRNQLISQREFFSTFSSSTFFTADISVFFLAIVSGAIVGSLVLKTR
jgi:hypothetical protein